MSRHTDWELSAHADHLFTEVSEEERGRCDPFFLLDIATVILAYLRYVMNGRRGTFDFGERYEFISEFFLGRIAPQIDAFVEGDSERDILLMKLFRLLYDQGQFLAKCQMQTLQDINLSLRMGITVDDIPYQGDSAQADWDDHMGRRTPR